MNKLQLTFLFIFTCLLSCKKDDTAPQPDYPDPDAPVIAFRDFKQADASLQATYFSTRVDSGILGTVTYFQGFGKASFRSLAGNFITPRKIILEGAELQRQGDVFVFDPGDKQGLDFGSEVWWKIEGRSDIPDFEVNIAHKVPEIGDVNIEDSISVLEELKLIIDSENPYTNLGQVDSIYYRIIGKKNELIRKTNALDTMYIKASELSGLGMGKAYIQAEAFRFELRSISGYDVNFVNQGVFNKQVWIY